MIGYLNKTKSGFVLTICDAPCNGEAFNNAEKVAVSGKREANQICKDRAIKPFNW